MNVNLKTETIDVAGQSIVLNVPANPDEILSEAADSSGGIVNDPYWGVLWPAATGTAFAILKHDWPETPVNSLEIGCGVGLAGVSGLLAGLKVTFSDAVDDAVKLAINNAELNGFPGADSLIFDWRSPPLQKFDLIFGSDVLYETENHERLLKTMSAMLAENGEVWLGDMGRHNAIAFTERAMNSGWNVAISDGQGTKMPEITPQRFQLLRFRR